MDTMVDIFESKGGQVVAAHGSVAQSLLTNGFNASSLRTNALLRYDEWKLIDEVVVKIARERLRGIADLVQAGLTKPLKNALGTTVLQFEQESDFGDAEINMDAVTRGRGDRITFTPGYLPIPIIHKDFHLTIRALEASRKRGEPIDTTQIAAATRKVTEKTEDILFNGSSSFAYGGGTIYGYIDAPHRGTVALSEQWTASSCTGQDILDDVLSMIEEANDAHYYGPFVLYVPTAYGVAIEDDFKAASDRTIRERLIAIESISDVRVSDKLTAHNVVLIQLTSDVVELVSGMQVQPVEWDEQGGMIKQFKIMSIMVPWIKSDADGNCGIVHLAAPAA